MPSIWFKMSNCKITLNFSDFQTISHKNYGKNCYLDNFVFLSPSPLNNVEEQWVKLGSSNEMGSQHGIGGEGKF